MDNLLQSGKIAVDNLLKYGATTWYDWSVQNWGTNPTYPYRYMGCCG